MQSRRPEYPESSRIDETARLYGQSELLEIGRNSRIDAFCVISVGKEGIEIGNNVHIGAGVYLFGGGGKIILEDCCFLSPRSTIYTATDDQAADCLIGPTVGEESRKVVTGSVVLRRGSGVGTGGIIFPGVTLGVGAIVGALSIAKRDVPDFHVIVGPNHRVVKVRDGQKIAELLERSK